MKTPSRESCYRLICRMKMLDHIVAHSLQVCRVSTLLAELFERRRISLNRELVQASALLHDITKTRSFETGENHAETGAKLLKDLGYPEVGRIIGQHVRLDAYAASGEPTEAEIVNYSDKRVLHDKIVSLTERMGYILEKYGDEPEKRERILWLSEKTRLMEARLFTILSISPLDLKDLLSAGDDFAPEYAEFRGSCPRPEGSEPSHQ
jgi:putative nucleotidyltransferase with HDIG domain